MNPKLALNLFVTLAVALAVASAMAQDEAPSRKFNPDSRPADNERFSDPVPETQKSADFRPSRSESRKSADAEPSSDLVRSPFKPRTTTDLFFRQIGSEETELVTQTNALARELETADSGSQRESVKAKLSELLGKQFDVRQKRHDREIKALEAQVKKLKDLVQKRQENREEIIARRLDQIVRESQGLGF